MSFIDRLDMLNEAPYATNSPYGGDLCMEMLGDYHGTQLKNALDFMVWCFKIAKINNVQDNGMSKVMQDLPDKIVGYDGSKDYYGVIHWSANDGGYEKLLGDLYPEIPQPNKYDKDEFFDNLKSTRWIKPIMVRDFDEMQLDDWNEYFQRDVIEDLSK